MSIGKRIRDRRKELKYSADHVAEKLGKNRATVYRYESDEIENMSIDVISSLSKVLETSPGYLMGWTDAKEDLDTAHEYLYFDTAISAGLPNNIEGLTEKDVDKIKIPDIVMGKWSGQQDIYITRITGDSMNNVMKDGSLIVVKPVEIEQLKDGDVVVYKYDNDYAVKRFFSDQDRVIFKPDSNDPTFTDLVISRDCENDLKIKGK